MSATADAYVKHHDTPFGAVLAMVADELSAACGKFEGFNSGHEGKAVIEEELDELWELVKANRPSSYDAAREAIQVAAMALRYVLDLCDPLAVASVGASAQASAEAQFTQPRSALRDSQDSRPPSAGVTSA